MGVRRVKTQLLSRETGSRLCLCFDFDGTLVKSMDAAFNAFQVVGPQLGCKRLTREELLAMRGLHVRDVIREMGVPVHRVPLLAARMRRAMRAELMETPPVEGVVDALRALTEQRCRLGILSSNARDSVAEYALRHGLEGFSFIVGGAGLLNKAAALRALLRRECLHPTRVAYVGDEARDVEAARSAGVLSVAVGWGYNSIEALAPMRPDHLLERPSELLALTRFNER